MAKNSQNEWIDIESQGLPDFRVYGFHTGRMVEVRLTDGTEYTVFYHGYGIFGDGTAIITSVKYWRIHKNRLLVNFFNV